MRGLLNVALVGIFISAIVGIAIAVFALLVLVTDAMVIKRAGAHGDAEWIQRGNYKNALGELCCGTSDCEQLSDADVRVVAGGFMIGRNEFVPTNETTPISPGGYWVCRWGGKRKCFFYAPGLT